MKINIWAEEKGPINASVHEGKLLSMLFDCTQLLPSLPGISWPDAHGLRFSHGQPDSHTCAPEKGAWGGRVKQDTNLVSSLPLVFSSFTCINKCLQGFESY